MQQINTSHSHISFSHIPEVPAFDAEFTACRTGTDDHFIDILNFSEKMIDRWTVPSIKAPGIINRFKENVDIANLPHGTTCLETYCGEHRSKPHIAHLSQNGKLFINVSDNYNGFCFYIIDTKTGKAYLYPDDIEETPMCYTSTGSLNADNRYWMYMRWPLPDAIDIMNGQKRHASCEIGRIHTDSLKTEILYSLQCEDESHQVAVSPSGRYAVFAPFKWDLNVPYPSVPMTEDPEGYEKSHRAGMKTYDIYTVDLERQQHWTTKITVPVLGHFEFDPVDHNTFYASAHNICPAPGGLMLEGAAAIYKLRIEPGHTSIMGTYSDESLFRIRQHVVFQYRGRTIIAATNFPNYLELIDAEEMSLWRRIELFSAPAIDVSRTGNALCPTYAESCFFINPSADGRYLVLGNSVCFSIYDLELDRVLDIKIPLSIPDGYIDAGHTKSKGI